MDLNWLVLIRLEQLWRINPSPCLYEEICAFCKEHDLPLRIMETEGDYHKER